MKAFPFIVLVSLIFPAGLVCAQESAFTQPTPVAASAPTVVPALVPFSGTAYAADGRPLAGKTSISFLLFREENGGEPLYVETQPVAVDNTGRYTAQLGATNARGLPSSLFSTGETRWLEVQIAGQRPQPRVLLASVPYAMKAADAATLGGLPASAFVLAGSQLSALAAAGASAITPDASSGVTTSGGTTNYVPLFTSANTIANSQIYDAGTGVGIGDIPNKYARLDVNGEMIMRGNMQVTRAGNATSAKGYPSYGFEFFSSAYNSSTKALDNPYFSLQSEPTGNNTSAPSATFNLLFANNGAAAAETGFYINPNGTVHFATGQTFPGDSGTITGVTAGTGLTGGGTSGAVTLSLDVTKVPTLTDSPVFAASGSSAALLATSSASSGTAFSATSAGVDGVAIHGEADGGGGIGVSGVAGGGQDNNKISPIGVMGFAASADAIAVEGYSVGGPAVYGFSTNNAAGFFESTSSSQAALSGFGSANGVQGISDGNGTGVEGDANGGLGVLGLSLPGSGTQSAYQAKGVVAGAWGDTGISASDNALNFGGILGTADDNHAGVFVNASNTFPSLIVQNRGGGGTGLFRTLQASTQDGTCGFGGKGDLSCTGQIKSLVNTTGARTVETYSVQSPENWMEDFGSGALVHGTLKVTLDPGFAQTVNAGVEYHVFLTPGGDCKGLYVTSRTADGFEVRELGGGISSVAFDYRVVARRAGYEAQRLTDVTERFQAETSRATARMNLASAVSGSIRGHVDRPRMPTPPAVRIPKGPAAPPNKPAAKTSGVPSY